VIGTIEARDRAALVQLERAVRVAFQVSKRRIARIGPRFENRIAVLVEQHVAIGIGAGVELQSPVSVVLHAARRRRLIHRIERKLQLVVLEVCRYLDPVDHCDQLGGQRKRRIVVGALQRSDREGDLALAFGHSQRKRAVGGQLAFIATQNLEFVGRSAAQGEPDRLSTGSDFVRKVCGEGLGRAFDQSSSGQRCCARLIVWFLEWVGSVSHDHFNALPSVITDRQCLLYQLVNPGEPGIAKRGLKGGFNSRVILKVVDGRGKAIVGKLIRRSEFDVRICERPAEVLSHKRS
jgi:hypothetical protein